MSPAVPAVPYDPASPGSAEAERARFRATFDHAPVAIAHVDPEMRFLAVNEHFCAFVGYSREELLGRAFPEITHPEDVGTDLVRFRELTAGRLDSYSLEKRYIRRDGQVVWGHLTVSLLRDPVGAPLFEIAVVVDITARKRGEQMQRLLVEAGELLANALDHDAVLGRLVGLATKEVADYALSYLVAEDGSIQPGPVAHADPARLPRVRELMRAMPPESPAGNLAAEVIRSGTPVFIPEVAEEDFLPEAAGPARRAALRELTPTSGIVVPLRARGRVVGALAVATTRAGRRRFTRDEVSLVEDLGTRAGLAVANARLYDAERRARAEAEQASEAKSRFLAVMSHELRTPLNAVFGYEDLLESGIAGPLTDRQRQYLERIRSCSHFLLDQINEILSLARIESGRETLEPDTVDLATLVHEAVAVHEPAARRKGLEIRAEGAEHALPRVTDGPKVRQILLNLISNAVKFTGQGEVVVELARTGARESEIRVHDTGSGIAPGDRERIFEPFVQLDQSSTRTAEGAGLGLAVGRRLARLLGGDLSVRAAPERGSTFVLRLPADAPTAVPSAR